MPLVVDKNLRGKTFDENLDALLNYKKILSVKVLFPPAESDADIKTLAELLTPPEDEILNSARWTIDDVDAVTGLAFEKIISDLYNGMKNFSAQTTPATNDYGADVVVESLTDDTGLLIQCKHTENPASTVDNKAVQEICAAVAHYEQKFFGRKFRPLVVTNAKNFTSNAITLAAANGVELIARRELENLLVDQKILKC